MDFTEVAVPSPAAVAPAPASTAPAPAPAPEPLPSPAVAMALSFGTTLAGIGVIVAGTEIEGQNAQIALVGTGVALVTVGPWVGRRYGNAVTSPWRNVRLVGLASTAVGLLLLPGLCFDEYEGTEAGCTVGAVLSGLGSIVWGVGTLAELVTTAADVRAAQASRVTATVGPVPGGAMLGISGLF